jgi:hypothetical protein
MKLNLRVTYSDATEKEIHATARDLVAFEDKFTKSIAALETDFRITDLLWIAWHWLHRTKGTSLDFEEWCDTVELIASSEESPK